MTDDLDRRIAASWRKAAGIADKMFGDWTSTARVSRAVADALAPPEPALKPCWSCGGQPIKAHGTCTFVMCGDETCGGNGYWKPVEQWNRRAEVPHG